MSTRKRSVEEEGFRDDEVIGPLPVVEEQPAKRKQKGYHSSLQRGCTLFIN